MSLISEIAINKADKGTLAEAIKLRNNGEHNDALKLIDQLMAKYPKIAFLLVITLDLHCELSQLNEAANLFRIATEV
jgi:predicted Zn-dependent protease